MAKNSRRQDPSPVSPETEPWTMPNTQTAFSKAERHRELLTKAREAVPLATAERYVRNSISYWDLVVMAEYDRLRAENVELREWKESIQANAMESRERDVRRTT